MRLSNAKVRDHDWLAGMYRDGYFPDALVDNIKAILLELCGQIESQQPNDDESLFVLTHAAVERINGLQDEFEEHDSDLETVAREVMADDFEFVARAYGFEDVDREDLIATRDW